MCFIVWDLREAYFVANNFGAEWSVYLDEDGQTTTKQLHEGFQHPAQMSLFI